MCRPRQAARRRGSDPADAEAGQTGAPGARPHQLGESFEIRLQHLVAAEEGVEDPRVLRKRDLITALNAQRPNCSSRARRQPRRDEALGLQSVEILG